MLCIAFHVCSSLIGCLGGKVNRKIKAMPSLKQVFQIGRTSLNMFRCMKNPNATLIQRHLKYVLKKKKSIRDILETQEEFQEEVRQWHIEANRKILERVIDMVILLSEQELAFRGHRESLANDPFVNTGNFLGNIEISSKLWWCYRYQPGKSRKRSPWNGK